MTIGLFPVTIGFLRLCPGPTQRPDRARPRTAPSWFPVLLSPLPVPRCASSAPPPSRLLVVVSPRQVRGVPCAILRRLC